MGCLDDTVMLLSPKLAACCLGLAVVNIYKGGQLHCFPPGGLRLHGSAWPYSSHPSEQQRCARFDPCPLTSLQVPRSGWTPPHHPQGGGVWWRPLLWGVLQWGGVLWRRQYAVRGQVFLFLTVLSVHVATCAVVPCSEQETCLPARSPFYMFTGTRTATQSMRLPKVTITQTLTMTMTNSLSTTTHGGHQSDGCFLQRLKVSFPLTPCSMSSTWRLPMQKQIFPFWFSFLSRVGFCFCAV